MCHCVRWGIIIIMIITVISLYANICAIVSGGEYVHSFRPIIVICCRFCTHTLYPFLAFILSFSVSFMSHFFFLLPVALSLSLSFSLSLFLYTIFLSVLYPELYSVSLCLCLSLYLSVFLSLSPYPTSPYPILHFN